MTAKISFEVLIVWRAFPKKLCSFLLKFQIR